MDLLTRGRLHLEHFVWGQLVSCVCAPVAVDRVLEEEQGPYSVTEQVWYSYALGQWENNIILEVFSILLVPNEEHARLPNSISPIAKMMIYAVDIVLWCNFLPSEWQVVSMHT